MTQTESRPSARPSRHTQFVSLEVRLSDGSVDAYVDGAEKEDPDEDGLLYSQVLFARHEHRISDNGSLLILRKRFRQIVTTPQRAVLSEDLLETTKAALYEPAQWESVREAG